MRIKITNLLIVTLFLLSFGFNKSTLITFANVQPRVTVCCDNMNRSTRYFSYHSAQVNNFPYCTITGMKVTYCKNCNVIFEQTQTSQTVHEHPEIF